MESWRGLGFVLVSKITTSWWMIWAFCGLQRSQSLSQDKCQFDGLCSVLLILVGILTENIVCLSFRKENTTVYTLVFARAECRKLLLRVTVCVRRFTVPVGKVYSSSSRWSAAILMLLLWEWKFGLQRSALSLEDRRSYFPLLTFHPVVLLTPSRVT